MPDSHVYGPVTECLSSFSILPFIDGSTIPIRIADEDDDGDLDDELGRGEDEGVSLHESPALNLESGDYGEFKPWIAEMRDLSAFRELPGPLLGKLELVETFQDQATKKVFSLKPQVINKAERGDVSTSKEYDAEGKAVHLLDKSLGAVGGLGSLFGELSEDSYTSGPDIITSLLDPDIDWNLMMMMEPVADPQNWASILAEAADNPMENPTSDPGSPLSDGIGILPTSAAPLSTDDTEKPVVQPLIPETAPWAHIFEPQPNPKSGTATPGSFSEASGSASGRQKLSTLQQLSRPSLTKTYRHSIRPTREKLIALPSDSSSRESSCSSRDAQRTSSHSRLRSSCPRCKTCRLKGKHEKDKRPYYRVFVHHALLTNASPYFAAALRFKAGMYQPKEIDLTRYPALHIQTIRDWLYERRLFATLEARQAYGVTSKGDISEEGDKDTEVQSGVRVVELYNVAHELGIEDLQDACIEFLCHHFKTEKSVPIEWVDSFWSEIPIGSAMREYWARHLTHASKASTSKDSRLFSEDDEREQDEIQYTGSLVRAMMRVKGSTKSMDEKTLLGKGCTFHFHHGEGEHKGGDKKLKCPYPSSDVTVKEEEDKKVASAEDDAWAFWGAPSSKKKKKKCIATAGAEAT